LISYRKSKLNLLLLKEDLRLLEYFVLLLVETTTQQKDDLVRVSDAKEFKKLLKSRSNILILFTTEEESNLMKEFTTAATKLRGKGTFAVIRCTENKASKKLCDGQLKPKEKFSLKHYQQGEFHKDYNRPLKAISFENFMLDPESEESPWSEDESAKDVVHLSDITFDSIIAKRLPTLVMFFCILVWSL